MDEGPRAHGCEQRRHHRQSEDSEVVADEVLYLFAVDIDQDADRYEPRASSHQRCEYEGASVKVQGPSRDGEDFVWYGREGGNECRPSPVFLNHSLGQGYFLILPEQLIKDGLCRSGGRSSVPPRRRQRM